MIAVLSRLYLRRHVSSDKARAKFGSINNYGVITWS
jgi:hypothetical protein